MIGLVAALIGLVLGVAAATLYKEHQINDLKSQLATQVTISQIAPGNGQLPWRPPVGRTGYSLGRQVAPTALLTRPAPVVFTRTLGRQVAPVSLLTRAAPPPPLVTPRTTLGRQVAPTSLLTRPAPVFFERTLGRQLAPLSLLTR
jgi:hypothetical protein